MFNARSHNQVLALRFGKRVTLDEMTSCLKMAEHLIVSMESGFCLLIDMGGLDSMDPACAIDLGKIMDLCDERKVSKIVAIVPDPTKDIGLRLLSLFHLNGDVRLELYENLPDAIGGLPTGS